FLWGEVLQPCMQRKPWGLLKSLTQKRNKKVGLTPHFLLINILFFSQHIEISHWSFDSLSGLIQLEQCIFAYKELIGFIIHTLQRNDATIIFPKDFTFQNTRLAIFSTFIMSN
ncbi:hypothetical protein, partial [Providencia stuartii]|uniref:hypothetical protein n=1 Tax=Providencia stuartii TaxID=588 RepID=UPI003F7077C2